LFLNIFPFIIYDVVFLGNPAVFARRYADGWPVGIPEKWPTKGDAVDKMLATF
jgi:hypothetical protein